jgi:hypothetical protein
MNSTLRHAGQLLRVAGGYVLTQNIKRLDKTEIRRRFMDGNRMLGYIQGQLSGKVEFVRVAMILSADSDDRIIIQHHVSSRPFIIPSGPQLQSQFFLFFSIDGMFAQEHIDFCLLRLRNYTERMLLRAPEAFSVILLEDDELDVWVPSPESILTREDEGFVSGSGSESSDEDSDSERGYDGEDEGEDNEGEDEDYVPRVTVEDVAGVLRPNNFVSVNFVGVGRSRTVRIDLTNVITALANTLESHASSPGLQMTLLDFRRALDASARAAATAALAARRRHENAVQQRDTGGGEGGQA